METLSIGQLFNKTGVLMRSLSLSGLQTFLIKLITHCHTPTTRVEHSKERTTVLMCL